MYWSKYVMGKVLLKLDDLAGAIKSELKEKAGGK